MRKGGCCKEKDLNSTDQAKNGNFKQNSMRNAVNSSQNANSSSGAQATFDFPLGISLGLLSLTKIF